MMESVASKDGCFDVDLEMGRTCSNPNLSGGEAIGNNMMKQLNSEAINVGIKSDDRVNTPIATNSGNDAENVKLMVMEGRKGDIPEKKKIVKERPKAMSAKKPPKPPRAPRGLSLDSSDQKLIRELHEIAKLKRARIERMKAVKKAKETKVASSKNQLFATLLTVLFCLVLLFQGISSRTSSAASFQGSPISTGVTENSIISVQHSPISSASNVNGPGSESSSRLAEHSSGVDTTEQANRAVR
ncbi:Bromodomain adjacent to zinc finger domain protein 2B [Bienertia sinuspersici]